MTDAKTLAYINLHAVLGSIPYLCQRSECRENFLCVFIFRYGLFKIL